MILHQFLLLISILYLANGLSVPCGRRMFLKSTLVGGIGFTISSILPDCANADIEGTVTPSSSDSDPKVQSGERGIKLYSTQSGLKYIVLREGITDAPLPRYGQFVTVRYKSYIKLPDTPQATSKLDQYDSDNRYLIKHGNGRIIPGLDEGIHTMKMGETRRLIIPPKLGYIGPGVLGPLPESPYERFRLNRLLDKMIDLKAGDVVLDVEIINIQDDEADQGYYEDGSISPEDFNTLRKNLQNEAREAQQKRANGAVDLLSGAMI